MERRELSKIKRDFFKCSCGFQTTLVQEVEEHAKHSLISKDGKYVLEGHDIKNLRGT